MGNKPILIFDLGGVLMQHNRETCQQLLENLLGADCLMNVLGQLPNGEGAEGSLMEQYELGLCTTDEFIERLLPYTSAGTTREEVIAAWNSIHAGIPSRYIETLQQLHNDGYRLLMLSNNNDLRWRHVCAHYDMSMFEHIFLSHELHAIKPEARFYQAVQDYLTPLETGTEIYFVDDLEANRLAAKPFGWKTFASVEDVMGQVNG